jgi:hypothetical protein
MEGWTDFDAGGRTYKMVVDGLALLGVTPPGMSTIRSLRDLPQALGIAASSRIAATLKSVTSETKEKGAGMDPAKIREALGLPADASDDAVQAALLEHGLAPKPSAPAVTQVPETKEESEEQLPPVRQLPVAAGAQVITLDPEQFKALQAQARRGDEAFRQLRESECEQVLDKAIKAGKFPPARREHWKALWAQDPDGTKETIERLQSGVIPVHASGYPGVGDETEADMLYNQMFPEGVK